MHRILLRTYYFDVPATVHEAELAFWSRALTADPSRGVNYPEYHELRHPAAVVKLYVQQIGSGVARMHLDIESDDVDAEVARLTGLGAFVVSEQRATPVGDWTVLRDPAGLLFCVVTAEPDDDFARRAIPVG